MNDLCIYIEPQNPKSYVCKRTSILTVPYCTVSKQVKFLLKIQFSDLCILMCGLAPVKCNYKYVSGMFSFKLYLFNFQLLLCFVQRVQLVKAEMEVIEGLFPSQNSVVVTFVPTRLP